ncbi:MAG TPA: VOC family protein [Gemmatimonadaceae bacterium]|nr:VOC family protein [Gemmatimonadaceae bacterium]
MPTRSVMPAGLAQRSEPETFRARTVSASLAVKDPQKSLVWYRDKVGFFVEQKFERGGKLTGFSLRAGDVRILISQDDGGSGWDRVKGAGFTLQLTTAQDIDGLAEAIKQRGGRLDGEPQEVSGTRVLRLRDPDGFRLVISASR